MICNGKELVEVRVGGSGAVTIMEFWTMEGYAVGFLIGVSILSFRRILGSYKGVGLVLSGGSFEDTSDGNLEGVRLG